MASATYETPALAIALLPESERQRAKDFASYTLEWLPMAASAARARASFTVASDVDFVALYVTGVALVVGAATVIAAPGIMLNLLVADRQIFDKDVYWNTIASGTAAAPFPLPFPLWLPKATTLTGVVSDLLATAANVRLTFHGFIMHQYGRQGSRVY